MPGPGSRCPICGKRLPVEARSDKKYCSVRCAGTAETRRKYARKRVKVLAARAERVAEVVHVEHVEYMASTEPTGAQDRTFARRGAAFDAFCAAGWPARIDGGEIAVSKAAADLDTSSANVSRWMKAWYEDRGVEARWGEWAESDDREDVAPLLAETPEAFAEFRRQSFTDEWGVPYQTPDFQLVWVAAVLKAIKGGGRLVILSPPRHGKTQLLIHFCVWLIIVRPNVRIMWIGGNEDIAKQATGAVLDILENTPELAERFLGPGRTWKPATRTGKSWSSERFTVATRVGAGIKSPTMVAVGKGGKLLSRDADLIVADDIIDVDSVKSPTTRGDDARWFNQSVSSRKEAHTALMAIGSRQHHEDLWGGLLTNRAFTSIVERAHDPACEVPTHKPAPINADEGHGPDCPECAAHHDCLLWPIKRTFAYLQDQRVAMDDDRQFEMVYLNSTHPDGDEHVTAEQLARCHDLSRGLGVSALPADGRWRLIAGLDPAAVGRQAAFLWAYDPLSNRRWMVDCDVEKGGSTPGARRIIREWHEAYGCKFWVVENIGYQNAILQDGDVVTYARENGVHIEGHFTHAYNKWDKDFGVTKQFSYYRSDPPLISLPWGSEDARDKVKAFEKELLSFQGVKTKTPTDLLMAAWFPEAAMRRWRTEERTNVVVDFEQTPYDLAALGDQYVLASA